MYKKLAVLAVLGLAGQVAVAGPVGLDFAFVEANGVPLIADGFDGPALDPVWHAQGSPGPLQGGLVLLSGGSGLFASIQATPGTPTIATMVFDVSQVLSGESTSMLFGGDVEGDFVGVRVGDGFASFFDETVTLGAIALDPGPVVAVQLAVIGDGNVVALANDAPIFAGPNDFGSPTVLLVNFVPEPVTFAFVGIGALACVLRRRP